MFLKGLLVGIKFIQGELRRVIRVGADIELVTVGFVVQGIPGLLKKGGLEGRDAVFLHFKIHYYNKQFYRSGFGRKDLPVP